MPETRIRNETSANISRFARPILDGVARFLFLVCSLFDGKSLFMFIVPVVLVVQCRTSSSWFLTDSVVYLFDPRGLDGR